DDYRLLDGLEPRGRRLGGVDARLQSDHRVHAGIGGLRGSAETRRLVNNGDDGIWNDRLGLIVDKSGNASLLRVLRHGDRSQETNQYGEISHLQTLATRI